MGFKKQLISRPTLYISQHKNQKGIFFQLLRATFIAQI